MTKESKHRRAIIALSLLFILFLLCAYHQKPFCFAKAFTENLLALDFLLMHVSGGMLFLFPFSWHGWQLGVVQCDNYYVALVALLLACVVYIISRYYTDKGEE